MSTHCPNCQSELSGSVFNSNAAWPQVKVSWFNKTTGNDASAYCGRCGDARWATITSLIEDEKVLLRSRITKNLGCMPVITLQQPLGWVYDVLDLVTGQSTTGTGLLTEFASSIADMLGSQNKRTNAKLKTGEELCRNQLRLHALDLGAHAVIGVDIDYAEVGGERGMLLVCMTGTAIRLADVSVLGQSRSGVVLQLLEDNDFLRVLEK
jgi:uncharacterized protein YbjQ (UPF0145 family)